MDCYIEWTTQPGSTTKIEWSFWFHIIAALVSLWMNGLSWWLPLHFLFGPFYLVYAMLNWIINMI